MCTIFLICWCVCLSLKEKLALVSLSGCTSVDHRSGTFSYGGMIVNQKFANSRVNEEVDESLIVRSLSHSQLLLLTECGAVEIKQVRGE